MLSTLALILVVLWAASYFGGFITGVSVHFILVVALMLVIVRLVAPRRLS